MNSRALAAKVLLAILDHKQSMAVALPQQQAAHPALRDAAFLQELCYGVLRHYHFLASLLAPLLTKPLKQKDHDIYYLLLIGLYQLYFLRVPSYAAISETVNATTVLKKPWAKNLVNAILRQFQREKDTLVLSTELTAVFSHSQWLITLLQTHWPEQWQAILTANNQHAPMTLRVNRLQVSREDYLMQLQAAEIEAIAHPTVPSAIELLKPVHVNTLPDFSHGFVSVQDAASQQAAALLSLAPGQRVLDACAAPGGKTCHIAETEPALTELVALDIDPHRVQKISENLQRLSLAATVKVGDASQPNDWWDGQLFDRILCDAPCSALGVIRRHPDIKFLRQPEDIPALQHQQLHILRALWPLLKPGGLLLYATCSMLPAETDDVLTQFIAGESTASQTARHCIVPGQDNQDGFYYGVLEKGI